MPKKAARKRLTRRELRDLDIEIGFLEGVVGRDVEFVEALQVLGDDYTRRGNYEAGLKVDERLLELRPRDPMVCYNLACSLALTKHYEQAVSALLRALEYGYSDLRWLQKDPDLDMLRRHPLYEKVQAKLKGIRIKIK
jgi:tetratricopeptide (TPR) repeat protein